MDIIETLNDEIKLLKAMINDVYAERNQLAIAMAKLAASKGLKAGRGTDSEMDPEWANVVYIEFDNGIQVSWHIAPTEAHLLDGLPEFQGEWDGTFIGHEKDWVKRI